MKGVLYSLIIGICLFSNAVNASNCDTSDKERLQKMANNISITIEEKFDNNGNVNFIATFTGVSKELRVFLPRIATFYYNTTGSYIGSLTVDTLSAGETYTFNIYGDDTCVYTNLRNITIDIPNYNPYYKEPICENAREHKLCQKWINNNGISYEKFISEIENYIKEKEKNNNIVDVPSPNDEFNFDFDKFYRKVYFPSLIITLILMGLLIYLWLKENKKNKL